LLILVGFTAVLPLAAAALSLLGLHARETREDHAKARDRQAQTAAFFLGSFLQARHEALTASLAVIPWATLAAKEREGALRLIVGQEDERLAAVLRDESGVVAAARRQGVEEALVLGASTAFAAQPASHFGEALLVQRAAAIPLFASVPLKDEQLAFSVLVSLERTCQALRTLVDEALFLAVVDADQRNVCGAPALEAAPRSDASELEARRSVGALTVLVRESPEHLHASLYRLQARTLYWLVIALSVALAGGLVLARDLTRPLAGLLAGARAIAAGDLRLKLPLFERSASELVELRDAFVFMGNEVERRDGEIRKHNDELHARVLERTRDLEEAQALLVEAKKMAALSVLGAGVAHEINNPLATVLGQTELLLADLSAEPERHVAAIKKLNSIEAEARRIRDIVGHLLALSQRESGSTRVRLSEVVDAAIAELSVGEKAKRVHIEVERAAEPMVRGDEAQLQRMLRELLDNAVSASRPGAHVVVSLTQPSEGLARVTVTDQGKGIEPEHLSKVFEPFFTTKGQHGNLGLGLSTVYKIVETHGGKVRIESSLDQGTSVSVTLPGFTPGPLLQ
jgi:signal transduction histidine kinase